jgi:CCR4-NOT transcription complex subunit 9
MKLETPKTQEKQEKNKEKEKEEIKQITEWVDQIKDENTREKALEELSHKRESLSDLALYIWYSTGTVATLLQEIINTYQYLAPPKLTVNRSNRACSVLALFQCVAAHPETRHPFLKAQIPIFLYPFLNTLNKSKPYEYIRLTALGVIGALVKIDNREVIQYLLNTEIIPLCLRIMERGSELSKTVACFIVQRILLDESGLKYICEKAERLNAINTVLCFMIKNKPSQRLVKHIIRSYNRLAENEEGKNLLKNNLPEEMKEQEFINSLDDSSRKWLANLNRVLKGEKTMNINNPNPNIGINNKNMNMNDNNAMLGNITNMGMSIDLNNNPNMGNPITINPNMMVLNQINLTNQGYMMQQQLNDFNFQMYGDQYLNNGIYMDNQNPNNGFGNMNYIGSPHLNLIIISYNIIENIELLVCCSGKNF